MKSRLQNVIHLVAFGLWSILTVLALALVASSLPAHSHETWQVDPQLSIWSEFAGLNAREGWYLEAYEPA
jgi:hypothetical protein